VLNGVIAYNMPGQNPKRFDHFENGRFHCVLIKNKGETNLRRYSMLDRYVPVAELVLERQTCSSEKCVLDTDERGREGKREK